jgi:hypothetical protein
MNQTNIEFISFKGGDGSSIHNAIEIVGAQSFSSGIQAEFEFINVICNENDMESAEGRIIFFTDAVIHHVNIVTKKGEIKNIFFNASGFQAQIENEEMEAVNTFMAIN